MATKGLGQKGDGKSSSITNFYYGWSSLHWTQEACCAFAFHFTGLTVWSLRLESDRTWNWGKFLSHGKCEAEVFPQKSQLSDEILFKSWNIWILFSSFQIIESNLWQNYWSVARFPAEPCESLYQTDKERQHLYRMIKLKTTKKLLIFTSEQSVDSKDQDVVAQPADFPIIPEKIKVGDT